jgi:outer membrane protein
MNKLTFGAAAAALAFATPFAANAQRAGAAVVVLVDTDQIFRTCTACVAAQAQLQAQVTSLQQRQQTLMTPLQAEAQSIQQAAQAAQSQTGAAQTAAQQALRTRVQALEARQNAANQELQRLEANIRSSQANVAQQINARLNPIYSQVMNARGANLLVPVAATLAHSGALNVTSDVLAALNRQLPSVSVTPLPQQQQQQQPPRPQGR